MTPDSTTAPALDCVLTDDQYNDLRDRAHRIGLYCGLVANGLEYAAVKDSTYEGFQALVRDVATLAEEMETLLAQAWKAAKKGGAS